MPLTLRGWGCLSRCSPIRTSSISRAYGTLKPVLTGIARSVCLIDQDGTVLYSQAGAPGAGIVLESLEISLMRVNSIFVARSRW